LNGMQAPNNISSNLPDNYRPLNSLKLFVPQNIHGLGSLTEIKFKINSINEQKLTKV